ncbi:hypothetical protein SAMN05192553_10746 [Cyclobacterium xiamenense]|uniref:Uncharacterized protein n=1 Tax=Cyclobacterium xiamenense TaxID=1297121 RepID=A0A1H7ASN2_9BACT|nr:hypothetical protein [Cyclobacterium xiamenense]SEJ64880.1 hypothetical protein SAMN05192553_10746 [Cyclobacterium xiamenense]
MKNLLSKVLVLTILVLLLSPNGYSIEENTNSSPPSIEEIELGSLISLIPSIIEIIPGIDMPDIFKDAINHLPNFASKLLNKNDQPNLDSVFQEFEDANERIDAISITMSQMKEKLISIEKTGNETLKGINALYKRIELLELNVIGSINEGRLSEYRNTIDAIVEQVSAKQEEWSDMRGNYFETLRYLYIYETNPHYMGKLFGYTAFYLIMEDIKHLDPNYNSNVKNLISGHFNDFYQRVERLFEVEDVKFNRVMGDIGLYLGLADGTGLLDRNRWQGGVFDDGYEASFRGITYKKDNTFTNRQLIINWKQDYPDNWIYKYLETGAYGADKGARVSIQEISIARDSYFSLLESCMIYKNEFGI